MTENSRTSTSQPKAQITPVTSAADFTGIFDCTASAFGHQTHDEIWTDLNPGWDTPEGAAAGIKRIISRWEKTTKDDNGNPNTVFLKATVIDPERSQEEIIVGAATWAQCSMVPGKGERPPLTAADVAKDLRLAERFPGDEEEQRYLTQLFTGLVAHRTAAIQAAATAEQPAVFALELCVVKPEFQRRGIAMELVSWGLREAERRGVVECMLEGSAMGRHVYKKLGFKEVAEVEYDVDEKWRNRNRPANVFMRRSGS